MQRISALEENLVIRRQRAAFAAMQILKRLKTKSSHVTERTGRSSFPSGAMCLRRIFDDF